MKLVVSCRFVTDVRDHDVKKADDGTVADPGEGSGGSGPPPSDLTLTTLRLKFLHRQDGIARGIFPLN